MPSPETVVNSFCNVVNLQFRNELNMSGRLHPSDSIPWIWAWACYKGARWPSLSAFVMGAWHCHQEPLALVDWTGPTKRPDGVFVCQRKKHTREICCPFEKTIGHEMDTVWITQKHILSLAFQDHKRPDGCFSSSQ